ncbi:MAG: hypothetical protein IK093_07350 [Ruminiclostridium sp.]|nr:hypothetical protein [Ruminiclostridium sp.]
MFRLIRKDTERIPYYRKVTQTSSYIGSQTDCVLQGYVNAQVSHVTDKAEIALYGDRVLKMYNLIMLRGSPLKEGDKVTIRGQDCRIISLLFYSDHVVAAAEKVGKA